MCADVVEMRARDESHNMHHKANTNPHTAGLTTHLS